MPLDDASPWLCCPQVDLTRQQRAYYTALYEQEIGTLLSGADKRNLPNLRNLAMELRKVCNHPFLCNGIEVDYFQRNFGFDPQVQRPTRDQASAVAGRRPEAAAGPLPSIPLSGSSRSRLQHLV